MLQRMWARRVADATVSGEGEDVLRIALCARTRFDCPGGVQNMSVTWPRR